MTKTSDKRRVLSIHYSWMRGGDLPLPDSNNPQDSQVVGLIASRLSSQGLACYYPLIGQVGRPERLLHDPRLSLSASELHAALSSTKTVAAARGQIGRWLSRGIGLVALGDPSYPTRLSHIFQPPPVLFYKGAWGEQINLVGTLAIVGARKADSFGCDIAYQMAVGVGACGGCVVSGLALGVDAKAHQGALSVHNTFPTVAVMGNGLSTIYPALHYRLAGEIVEKGGLLVTQFEPDEKPYPSNFLNRNRVIAGLSDGVLVVQASRQSGALVTARYALEEGREVMAVPGSILDERYEGSNRLLKQGAQLVASVSDILDILPQLNKKEERPSNDGQKNVELGFPADLSPGQKKILELLRAEQSVHFHALAARAGNPSDFSKEVLQLELDDLIYRLPGNYVAIRPSLLSKWAQGRANSQ
jgi:DNA processing protein